MIFNTIENKGILVRLLEQGMKILLKKECKKISNIKVDIISSTTNLIKGDIEKINIYADCVDYKDLLFDEIKLEAHHLKINFQIKKKELNFTNEPIIKFVISLSQNSLKRFLSSKNWNWIKIFISKNLLNQARLDGIKIKNDKLLINTFEKKNNLNEPSQIEIKANKGKINLININNKKSIQIPIEEKIYIDNIYIENNLISILGNSSISF